MHKFDTNVLENKIVELTDSQQKMVWQNNVPFLFI